MSRAYKIKLPAALTDLNISKNKISLEINLMPILDKKRMSDILKKILENLGAKEDNGIMLVKNGNGIIYKIDPQNLNLEIDLSEILKDISIDVYEESLSREITRMDNSQAIELTQKQLESLDINTQNLINAKMENVDQELQKQLVGETFKARQYINQLLKEIYKEAIGEKARSMGNISSISESQENGEYRVRMIID